MRRGVRVSVVDLSTGFKTKFAEQYPQEFASMFFRLLCPSHV